LVTETMNLVQLAEERSYDALEGAWLSALDEGVAGDASHFIATADVLASQNEPERAATLLALVVPALKAASEFGEAARVLRRAAALAARPDDLRGELVECLKKAHEDRPGFDAYLKKSQLADKASVRAALEKLDRFLDFPLGRHVFHAAGWGVGRVVDVEKRTGDLTIDFEKKKGHALPIESACDFLQRLADEHIWSMRFSAKAELEKLRDESPGELVKIVAASQKTRKATLLQVKQELLGSVVPEKGWSKFWTKAKSQLLHDPLVEVSDDARPTISLRARAIRYSDEVRAKIERAASLAEAGSQARQFMKRAGKGAPGAKAPEPKVDQTELQAVANALCERLSKEAAKLLVTEPGVAIETLFILEDFAAAQAPTTPNAEVAAAAKDLERFLASAAQIEEQAYLKRYVEHVRKQNPQWAERFAATLATAPRDVFALATGALKEAAPQLLSKALVKIAASPDPDPDAFLELAREAFAGRFDGVPGAPPTFQVFEKLLAFADRLERLRSGGAPGVPNVRPRVRSLLEDGDFGVVRRYFQGAEKEPVKHAYQRIMASHAVDDEVREVARAVVVRRFPEFLAGSEKKHFWEDGNIYVTRKGLAKYQAEFQELANEKIPENARAIGAAAALGDLSENAEFTAALEERDQLVARADRMKKDLEKAKPLEEAPVDEAVIGPGTRIELRNQDGGATERWTVLGPWDADLESSVISYTAPLAKGLLGRKVGEVVEVTLPGGGKANYEVARIEKVI
jgi:transcription elongation GreA/GreB family factor